MRVILAWFLLVCSVALADEPRPNLLWITVEDMSPNLGCYGDGYARTPNLDAFARESVRFTHAFAASPICSPSRSCLITGLYPVSMGTHQMRSAFSLSAELHGFPSYLRKAGYFTTNNAKTDYNTADEPRLIAESWDESGAKAHWRDPQRTAGQPFFAVFNDMTTHQSRSMSWSHEAFRKHVQSKLKPEEIHDPALASVPPYYPDTPVIRRTLARYADCITLMDRNVGGILAELEADGLAEDTIVFFFSDHGAGLPRHKRMLYDSGMRVPLMIRFPEKFKHLAPAPPGTVVDQLVSFVDFAPTMLHLAGCELPATLQGKPFVGPQPDVRDYVYGSRDRVDEAFDTIRSLRDQRYLYVRNFHPLTSCNQPEAYSDTSEIRQEITAVARKQPEALTVAQRDYAGPTKPVEAFYDSVADPHQIDNLLDGPLTPDQTAALARFRQAFQRYRTETGDLGCLTEDSMWRRVKEEGMPVGDLMAGKSPHPPDLSAVWAAADLVGSTDLPALRERLGSSDPDQRYWALLALRQAGFADLERIAVHLDDLALPVRFEAARWLVENGVHRERAITVLADGVSTEDWWNALYACRMIELLGDRARAALPAMRGLYERNRHKDGDAELFLAFSSGAWLEGIGEKVIPWDFSPEAGPFRVPPAAKIRAIDPGASTAEWKERRAGMVEAWQSILGPLPAAKVPLRLEVISEESLPGFKRQYIPYLAAFDERVKATVFSEGGIGLPMSNWEAPWYLGPQVKEPGFGHDHEELIALIAPRAFLLIGGDSADTDDGLDYVRAAQPVFDLAGAGNHLRFFNHRQGHRYPPEARQEAEAFFKSVWGE